MAGRLEGKAALITGASKGIGRGIAEAFLEQGASVFLCARDEERLVNNASILGKRAKVEELDVATWDEVLKVNTSSLFYVTKPLIPHLKSRGEGSIINVSSSVGRRGKANWNAYAVSKFGLEAFTQVLAAELEEHGIRVNSVNPGATRTDMRAVAYPDEDPMSLPTPKDIAEVFVFLASDASDTTTGQAFEARDYMKTTWS